MKLSYAVKNVRRIWEMPDIELKPLTVLVGKNSAGKSTFLRSLPLIRQSIETRSSAPILWYGDLVDFGNLETVIQEDKNGDERRPEFKFCIKDLKEKSNPRRYFNDAYRILPQILRFREASIRYTIGGKGEITKLMTVAISIPDENIELVIDSSPQTTAERSIQINGESVSFLTSKYAIRLEKRHLFSAPYFMRRADDKEDHAIHRRTAELVLVEELSNLIKRKIKRKVAESTIQIETQRILSCENLDPEDIRNLVNESSRTTFRNLYIELGSPLVTEFKDKVLKLHKIVRVIMLLGIFEDVLTDYFLDLRYLGPVRAASERYYRKQELEVSGIAPDASNFPMFLASLSEREIEDFSNWIEVEFGFGVEIQSLGGHISIHLRSPNQSVNITDTGYGMSQMLPVLGMIWWAHSRREPRRFPRRRNPNVQTLVIEQPELHLHPAHQAKLADIFAASIKRRQSRNTNSMTSFIIETHSEALIQRLGELIEKGRIEKELVQIVIFSAKDDLGSPSEISISEFDERGGLKNWPYGFFNYSE